MRVDPIGSTWALARSRPTRAQSGPRDVFRSSDQLVARTAVSPAQAAAGGLFGPAAQVTASELEKSVQRLQSNGFSFQTQGKLLFWQTGFKARGPEQTAQAALEQKPILVSSNMHDAVEIKNAQDLMELDAFYGSHSPRTLQHPDLAAALHDLERAGGKFLSDPGNVGSYGAYNLLTEQSQGLRLQLQNQTYAISHPEDACFLAFSHNLEPPDGLSRVQQAQDLVELEKQGFQFKVGAKSNGNALDAYRAQEFELVYKGCLLKDPQIALQRKQECDQLKDPELYGTYLKHPTRPFQESLQFLTSLDQMQATSQNALYEQVLQLHDPAQPLQATAQLALDALRVLEKPDGQKAAAATRHIRETQDQRRYLTYLRSTQDPELSKQAADRTKNPQDEQFFLDLVQAHPKFALEAFQQNVPEDQRPLFLKVFQEDPKAHPQGDPETWLALREALKGKCKPEELTSQANRLQGQYPQDAADLARVLKASKSSLAQDEKLFQDLQGGPDRVRLFEATGNLEDTRLAAQQLERPSTSSPEQRREALATLMEQQKDTRAAIEDFHFLQRLQRDNQEGANALLKLQKASADGREARLALAFLHQAQDPSEEAMVQCLQAFGTLQDARVAYQDIEQGGPEGWPARQKALEQTQEIARMQTAPSHRLELYQALTRAQLADIAPILELATAPGFQKPEGAWTRDGDQWKVPCTKRDNNFLISDAFALPPHAGAALEFDLTCETQQYDRLYVDASNDGQTWYRIAEFGGKKSQGPRRVSLNFLDGQPQARVRFRMHVHESSRAAGAQVSNVRLTLTPQDLHRETRWSSNAFERGTLKPKMNDGYARHLVSEPIHVPDNARLSFQASWDLEGKEDACSLEVSTDGKSYTSLYYIAKSKSEPKKIDVDLSAYAGKQITLRFNQKVRGRTGIQVEDLRLHGCSAGQPTRSIPMADQSTSPFDPRAIVECLNAEHSLAQLARLAEKTDLKRARALQEAIHEMKADEASLLTLEQRFGLEEAKKLYAHVEPGLAELMLTNDPRDYQALRNKLRHDHAGNGDGARFYAEVIRKAGPEMAEKAWPIVTLPVGPEQDQERQDAFLQLLDLQAYQAITQIVLPADDLKQAARAFKELAMITQGPEALKATEELQQRRLEGKLDLPLAEALKRLSQTMLTGQLTLDQAIAQLDATVVTGIEVKEDKVVIGGTVVRRN